MTAVDSDADADADVNANANTNADPDTGVPKLSHLVAVVKLRGEPRKATAFFGFV